MSYQLGSVGSDDRAAAAAAPRGRVRLLPRGLLSSALVVLVMAAFAGGVWFAHFAARRHAGGGTGGGVPLIRADRHPFKLRPAAPGGMVVPDQNMLVYGERHDRVEHLLPPPEKPLPRPTPPPPPPPKPQVAAAPPPPAAAVRPAAAVVAPPSAVPAAPGGPAASNAPAAAASATPTPATPAVAPLRPAIARSGGFRLVLGSVRTPEAARRAWQHLKEANADLLGAIDGFAMPIGLGGKGVAYRIETSPLADRAVAAKICGALKERGAGCVLGR